MTGCSPSLVGSNCAVTLNVFSLAGALTLVMFQRTMSPAATAIFASAEITEVAADVIVAARAVATPLT